jgi:hypothetical protein
LAIDAARKTWNEEDFDVNDKEEDDDVCTMEPDGRQSCEAATRSSRTARSSRYYASLRVEDRTELNFENAQCAQGRRVDFDHYPVIEEFKSQYQEIEYFQDPVTKNTCLGLDGIVQICGSVRLLHACERGVFESSAYHELLI